MMKLSKKQNIVLSLLFCGFLGLMFLLHFQDLRHAARSFVVEGLQHSPMEQVDPASFEASYNASYTENPFWRDTYGLANRLLKKREVSNFEVIADKNGFLYIPEKKEIEGASPEACIKSVEALADKTSDEEVSFLFIQAPYKTYTDKSELDGYAESYLDERYDETLSILRSKGINTLDLREEDECAVWYRTDHHWTADAAFSASRYIVACLEDIENISVLENKGMYADKNFYEQINYGPVFLGSSGIKVGSCYAGRDDFSYLSPNFDTKFSLEHRIDGELDFKHEGSFDEAFIDQEILNNESYNNKYNSFLYGAYVESIVINENATNDIKVLLVAHSYGRPLVPYLSLYFSEIRYLDPQEGRFTDNYLAYFDEYDPDVVLVMYNGTINVGQD